MVEDIGPETLRERDPKKLIPPLHGALSRTSRTCTCSSGWHSWRDAKAADARGRTSSRSARHRSNAVPSASAADPAAFGRRRRRRSSTAPGRAKVTGISRSDDGAARVTAGGSIAPAARRAAGSSRPARPAALRAAPQRRGCRASGAPALPPAQAASSRPGGGGPPRVARLPCGEALAGAAIPPVVHLRDGAADAPPAHTSSNGRNAARCRRPRRWRARCISPAIAVVLSPCPPKPLASQTPRRSLADLRHAVHGVADDAGPGVLDLDVAELRIGLRSMSACSARHKRRGLRSPGRHAARPHQPVAVDDAVVVVGEVGVAHRAAIARSPRQAARRAARSSPHRSRPAAACREPRHQSAEMDVAGEHDMVGAQPRRRA